MEGASSVQPFLAISLLSVAAIHGERGASVTPRHCLSDSNTEHFAL